MTLTDLIKRLEAATGPDRELDAEIANIVGHRRLRIAGIPETGIRQGVRTFEAPYYTASIVAAVDLAEELCLGHGWQLTDTHATVFEHGVKGRELGFCERTDMQYALALTTAVLKAVAEQEEG